MPDDEPYFDPTELSKLQAQIAESGFEADPLLGPLGKRPFAGLNITMAWPFPNELRRAYEKLTDELSALDPGLDLYPFERSHVTVVTAVSFKEHAHPSTETVKEVADAAALLGDFLFDATRDMGPFAIDVGPPVLARAAAFLPMKNPGGEVARLRDRTLAFCRSTGGILARAVAPRIVHSTLLRFRRVPTDAHAFAAGFERVVRGVWLGQIRIDELAVTLEPKPYMREGTKARVVGLDEPR
jgi:hypothetical protein